MKENILVDLVKTLTSYEMSSSLHHATITNESFYSVNNVIMLNMSTVHIYFGFKFMSIFKFLQKKMQKFYEHNFLFRKVNNVIKMMCC